MSNINKKNTNMETFNRLVRRTSDRLRGGSVPPPSSEVVVTNTSTASRRGRGRGRGQDRGEAITGNTTQAAITPVVTLTVPGVEGGTISNSSTGDGQEGLVPNTQDRPEAPTTSVIHSTGLLSRDHVYNESHGKLHALNIPPQSDAAQATNTYSLPP